jgi:hypothetical protein
LADRQRLASVARLRWAILTNRPNRKNSREALTPRLPLSSVQHLTLSSSQPPDGSQISRSLLTPLASRVMWFASRKWPHFFSIVAKSPTHAASAAEADPCGRVTVYKEVTRVRGITSCLPTTLHLADGWRLTTCLPEAARNFAAIRCLGTLFSVGVRLRNSMAAASRFRYAFKNSRVYRAIQL